MTIRTSPAFILILAIVLPGVACGRPAQTPSEPDPIASGYVRALPDDDSPMARMAGSISPGRAILDSIRESMQAQPGLGPCDVDLHYRNGEVSIRGLVRDAEVARQLLAIAAKTPGVKSVRDETRLQSAPSDGEIEQRLLRALRNDPKVLPSTVQFRVEDGVAEFSGSVENHRQIDRILAIALDVEGIKDVRSEVAPRRASQVRR